LDETSVSRVQKVSREIHSYISAFNKSIPSESELKELQSKFESCRNLRTDPSSSLWVCFAVQPTWTGSI